MVKLAAIARSFGCCLQAHHLPLRILPSSRTFSITRSQGFTKERREKSLRWLYGALLRAVTPSSTGCIPLQTAGGQAVAVWFSKSHDLSPLQVMLAGGWQYVWRYSGWARRGRFPGYAQVISSVRSRLMSAHAGAFFYLLTFARRPELPEAEGRAQLAAVMQPVFERVRWIAAAAAAAASIGRGRRRTVVTAFTSAVMVATSTHLHA